MPSVSEMTDAAMHAVAGVYERLVHADDDRANRNYKMGLMAAQYTLLAFAAYDLSGANIRSSLAYFALSLFAERGVAFGAQFIPSYQSFSQYVTNHQSNLTTFSYFNQSPKELPKLIGKDMQDAGAFIKEKLSR